MTPRLNTGKLLAIATAVVVSAAVVTSLWLTPPATYRAKSLDEIRARSLYTLKGNIKSYYHLHQKLPTGLDALLSAPYTMEKWHDPATHQPYEYEIISKTGYRLCATFALDSNDTSVGRSPYNSTFDSIISPYHAGRNCFEYDVVRF